MKGPSNSVVNGRGEGVGRKLPPPRKKNRSQSEREEVKIKKEEGGNGGRKEKEERKGEKLRERKQGLLTNAGREIWKVGLVMEGRAGGTSIDVGRAYVAYHFRKQSRLGLLHVT